MFVYLFANQEEDHFFRISINPFLGPKLKIAILLFNYYIFLFLKFGSDNLVVDRRRG